MKLFELLTEKTKVIPWNGNPNIGWWEDSKPLIMYHGTYKDNVEGIMKSELRAPSEGPTAGWISLALEPNTAYGYASMRGGESAFRAAGASAMHVQGKDRAVLVMKFPNGKSDLEHLGLDKRLRGNTTKTEHLTNKELYEKWAEQGKQDQEYYALTELRIPEKLSTKYIVGVMYKS